MTTRLHRVLTRLKLSDSDFADEAGVARGQVWAWRTGKKLPRGESAVAVQRALAALGVSLTLEELVLPPKRKQRSASAA